MISCPLCQSFQGNSLRDLLHHMSLQHSNDATFHVLCGIDSCPCSYTNFGSFRSHVYRVHRNALMNEIVAPSSSKLISCPMCATPVAISVSKVSCHLRSHIESGDLVECPYEDCFSSYRVYSSLTSHIYRYHNCLGIQNFKQAWLCEWISPGVQDGLVMDSEDLSSDSASIDFSNFESDFLRTYSLFILKLQEKLILPVSTINSVMDDVSNLCELSQSFQLHNVQEILQRHLLPNIVIDEISSSMNGNAISSAKTKLGTEWIRKSYFRENLHWVEPEAHNLGRNDKGLIRNYQYIPILKTLKILLQHRDVYHQVTHPPVVMNNILKDFRDGSHFKTNELFSQHPNALQIFLYYDEFEVVNPLGSHTRKHKIGAFYYVLGNFYPEKRSVVYGIQLALLCRYTDLKYFGLKKVLQPLIHDIKILEIDGVVLDEVTEEKFYGTVAVLSGDNLGSHYIGGFSQNFSGGANNRICRFCMATREGIQKKMCPTAFTARTIDNYSKHAKFAKDNPGMAKVYGVYFDSPLNSCKYFHVASGLPPDIMHDLLEGILPYEIALTLKELIRSGTVSLPDLNKQIRTWKYGALDARNKPIEISTEFKDSIKQNAGRMWVLIRLLPLMLSRQISLQNNIHFQFLLLQKRIVEIVFSPVLRVSHVAYLDSLIQDHHRLFRQLFPNNRFKPKQHYLIHYPDMMLMYGPLIRLWCMRFEAKHGYFKNVVKVVRNFKNIPYTLASRHQLLQAYHSSSGLQYLRPEIEVSSAVSVCIDTLCHSVQQLLHGFGDDDGIVRHTDEVCVNGLPYRVGVCVVVNFIQDSPIFGVIKMILVQDRDIKFVVDCFESQLNENVEAHYFTEPKGMLLISHVDLKDHYPLSVYCLDDMKYVVLKHVVFDHSS